MKAEDLGHLIGRYLVRWTLILSIVYFLLYIFFG